jgi:hypothetical protein
MLSQLPQNQGEPLFIAVQCCSPSPFCDIFMPCAAPSKNEIVIFISRGERLEMKR